MSRTVDEHRVLNAVIVSSSSSLSGSDVVDAFANEFRLPDDEFALACERFAARRRFHKQQGDNWFGSGLDAGTAREFVQLLLVDLMETLSLDASLMFGVPDPEAGWGCLAQAQFDTAPFEDAFLEIARDYTLMQRGVRVSANTPVRICVITDGEHWVFVRCRELMVDRVRQIVLVTVCQCHE